MHLLEMAKTRTGVQLGKVLAFVSAVRAENRWIICIMAIERLQIIFPDVSQQSDQILECKMGDGQMDKTCFEKFCSGLVSMGISRLHYQNNCICCQIIIIFSCN